MKLHALKRHALGKIAVVLAGGAGLLAYGYFLAFPWYWRLADGYRWSILARRQAEAGLAPAMLSMEAMMPVAAPAGEHHKAMQMVLDLPGVSRPKLRSVKAAKLHDDDNVFGIVVDGKAYAFAREAMLERDEHIVNMLAGEKPFSVTYCSFRDCVRVLARDGGTEPIDLRCGGLDVSNQLVYLLDGVRYGQSSEEIPLEDLPFERTTFGEWKREHPDTLVYSG